MTPIVLVLSFREGRQLGDLRGADGQLGPSEEIEESESMREKDESRKESVCGRRGG